MRTHGEQKDHVFSVETNLVTLDATVTDQRSHGPFQKEVLKVFEAER
jgi:hypothetical protein